MWIALAMAVVGLIVLVWPDPLVRTDTPGVLRAARVAGGLLLIGALLLALAEG